MSGIFISYRREDAEGQAGRLFERLHERFGAGRVFMDVTGIAPGLVGSLDTDINLESDPIHQDDK